MSVNDDNRDDTLARDPRLARLLEVAGGEEPPASLDAAILAAARREVHTRPQVVETGGGGETGAPVRAKRNWYVPVSIAAVLILSVSLVTLVHEEKGDELAQPPRTAGAPSKSSAPVAATEVPATAPAEKRDAMLRDVAPTKPNGTGGFSAAPERERRPEPFPAASEREAPAPVSAPALGAAPATITAQPSRDAVEAGVRSEAGRNATRSPMQEAPAVATASIAPPPAAKTAPASAAKPALRPLEKRAQVWRGLEEQPPEKWLDRLAELKRDGRQADADELLAEFRRRFPNHPASTR